MGQMHSKEFNKKVITVVPARGGVAWTKVWEGKTLGGLGSGLEGKLAGL